MGSGYKVTNRGRVRNIRLRLCSLFVNMMAIFNIMLWGQRAAIKSHKELMYALVTSQ